MISSSGRLSSRACARARDTSLSSSSTRTVRRALAMTTAYLRESPCTPVAASRFGPRMTGARAALGVRPCPRGRRRRRDPGRHPREGARRRRRARRVRSRPDASARVPGPRRALTTSGSPRVSGEFLASWDHGFGSTQPNITPWLSVYGTEGHRFESCRARFPTGFFADLSVGLTPRVKRSNPRV